MKENRKRDLLGMAVYFGIAVLFGGAAGVLALIIKEDNDRCHYGNGRYEWGDLVRGCVAVAIGVAVRWVVGITSP